MEPALLALGPTFRLLLWAATILFSCATGYSFATAVPHWAGDSSLEAGEFSERYSRSGYDDDDAGCILSAMMLGGLVASARRTTWAPLFWSVLALAGVIWLYLPTKDQLLGFDEEALSRNMPLWLALGAVLVGYIAGRALDRGPVGPLE